MAKILVATSGLTGILNASMALVDDLRAEGHEVEYTSPRDVRTRIETNGYTYRQLPMIDTATTPDLPQNLSNASKLAKWKHRITHRTNRQAEAYQTIFPSAFVDLVTQHQYDRCIIDVELHEYIIVGVGRGWDVVLLSQWFSLWERPGLPYLLTDTIPGVGFSGSSLGLWLSWRTIRLKRWYQFTKIAMLSLGTDRRSLLFMLARAEGFPLKYIKENNWPGPFVYDHLPLWAMVDEALEFPHPIRPNMSYLGPKVKSDRKDPPTDREVLLRIEKAIAQSKKTSKKLICCTVSSLHSGDTAFLFRVIEACSGEEDLVLIIALGGKIDSSTFGTLASNIIAVDRLPQLMVLEHADLSINHAGIHTINECLHYNVPMLIYSGKRSDQNGCAARVHYHKRGIMADKDKDTVEEIRGNIRRILQSNKSDKNNKR